MITEIYRLLLKNMDYKNTKKNRTSIKTGGSINSSFFKWNNAKVEIKDNDCIAFLSGTNIYVNANYTNNYSITSSTLVKLHKL